MIALLIIAALLLTFVIGWLTGYEACHMDNETHPSRRQKGTPR